MWGGRGWCRDRGGVGGASGTGSEDEGTSGCVLMEGCKAPWCFALQEEWLGWVMVMEHIVWQNLRRLTWDGQGCLVECAVCMAMCCGVLCA